MSSESFIDILDKLEDKYGDSELEDSKIDKIFLSELSKLINNKLNEAKYSQNTTFDNFVKKNSVNKGTGETIQQVKLPLKQDKLSSKRKAQEPETYNSVKNNTLNQIRIENNNEELPDTRQFIVNKRTKDRATLKEIKDTLSQKFVNKGHYIDKLAKQANNKKLTYLYDRTMNTFNEAQISIGTEQINSKGTIVGKSLIDIFKPSEEAKLKTEFEDYLLNKHNISRTAVGKSLYGDDVTAPQSKRIVENYEKEFPEFKKWSDEVNKYNDNNLKDLVDNGMVSKDTYSKLKELYGDYVPTFRDITETMQEFIDNERVGGNTLKYANKSNKPILSIKESMAEQTLAIKKAIRINNVGIELYKMLGKDSKILDGINVDSTTIGVLGGDVIKKEGNGKNTFAIFQEGEITYFNISDELFTAFNKDITSKLNENKVAKTILMPIEKSSRIQRDILTTYSIGFAFNNPIKDFQDAIFNTKYSTKDFLKNYNKALYNIATDGDWYKNYKRQRRNS